MSFLPVLLIASAVRRCCTQSRARFSGHATHRNWQTWRPGWSQRGRAPLLQLGRAGREQAAKLEVDHNMELLIASLSIFTMASMLVAQVLPFSPDVKLRLILMCHHAFHIACIYAWLHSTPSYSAMRETLPAKSRVPMDLLFDELIFPQFYFSLP